MIRSLIAALVVLAAPLATIAPASAEPSDAGPIPGCPGKYRTQEDWRSHRHTYKAAGGREMNLVVSKHTGYYFCPRGPKPDIIQPYYDRTCWSMPTHDEHYRFQGIQAGSVIYRTSHDKTGAHQLISFIGSKPVFDDVKRSMKCKTRYYIDSERIWHPVRSTKYKVIYRVDLAHPKEQQKGWFTDLSSHLKTLRFSPQSDYVQAPRPDDKPGWYNDGKPDNPKVQYRKAA